MGCRRQDLTVGYVLQSACSAGRVKSLPGFIGRFIIAVDTPWPICVRAGIVCVCLSGDVSE
jgi:hypothetical protein